MTIIKPTPTTEFPMPYDKADEKVEDPMGELQIAAATADVLEGMGAPIEVSPEDYEEEKRLIDAVTNGPQRKPITHLPTAVAASAFLRAYGTSAAHDVNQIRTALTNKLLEIADCGETKYELKAIELLGKHSDVGLFTERSEINVNYNSPEALETAIKERVKRLLNADVIDIRPLSMDLDDELGILDGEFAELDDSGLSNIDDVFSDYEDEEGEAAEDVGVPTVRAPAGGGDE